MSQMAEQCPGRAPSCPTGEARILIGDETTIAKVEGTLDPWALDLAIPPSPSHGAAWRIASYFATPPLPAGARCA